MVEQTGSTERRDRVVVESYLEKLLQMLPRADENKGLAVMPALRVTPPPSAT